MPIYMYYVHALQLHNIIRIEVSGDTYTVIKYNKV